MSGPRPTLSDQALLKLLLASQMQAQRQRQGQGPGQGQGQGQLHQMGASEREAVLREALLEPGAAPSAEGTSTGGTSSLPLDAAAMVGLLLRRGDHPQPQPQAQSQHQPQPQLPQPQPRLGMMGSPRGSLAEAQPLENPPAHGPRPRMEGGHGGDVLSVLRSMGSLGSSASLALASAPASAVGRPRSSEMAAEANQGHVLPRSLQLYLEAASRQRSEGNAGLQAAPAQPCPAPDPGNAKISSDALRRFLQSSSAAAQLSRDGTQGGLRGLGQLPHAQEEKERGRASTPWLLLSPQREQEEACQESPDVIANPEPEGREVHHDMDAFVAVALEASANVQTARQTLGRVALAAHGDLGPAVAAVAATLSSLQAAESGILRMLELWMEQHHAASEGRPRGGPGDRGAASTAHEDPTGTTATLARMANSHLLQFAPSGKSGLAGGTNLLSPSVEDSKGLGRGLASLGLELVGAGCQRRAQDDASALPQEKTCSRSAHEAAGSLGQPISEKDKASGEAAVDSPDNGGASLSRVVLEVASEMPVLQPSHDGYQWRRYGRKTIKDAEYPRLYYRCAEDTCSAKKHMQLVKRGSDSKDGATANTKPTFVTAVSYENSHSHPCPNRHPSKSLRPGKGHEPREAGKSPKVRQAEQRSAERKRTSAGTEKNPPSLTRACRETSEMELASAIDAREAREPSSRSERPSETMDRLEEDPEEEDMDLEDAEEDLRSPSEERPPSPPCSALMSALPPMEGLTLSIGLSQERAFISESQLPSAKQAESADAVSLGPLKKRSKGVFSLSEPLVVMETAAEEKTLMLFGRVMNTGDVYSKDITPGDTET